ncbi:hypothetical protein EVAR_41031_1 [Eumeta japonica]|uniref:Uncharacterized protein n=1 Tax=Eumeta variegata TaxID=151549 RepID=A0A4C1Z348_EUMVA|nr:hypothetical protein EVAR_41031_1 [Eumeta japonica]
MGRPTKDAAHRSHPYCKPLRNSIDYHIRLDYDDYLTTATLWAIDKGLVHIHRRIQTYSTRIAAVSRYATRATERARAPAPRCVRQL